LTLSPEEEMFFRDRNPWGLILFKRNCQTPDQLRSLTSTFRNSVGRRDAPVFIDQEGGRVQRLGPPSNAWRKYPAAGFSDLCQRSLRALRSARRRAQ
jgi:beta-N-acetylhexosaminidase